VIEGWPEQPHVESIATDGFLFANRVLAERNITMRKGFPESYDVPALRQAIAAIKRGMRVSLPLYSHVTYDVDTENVQDMERPAIVVLDGLHLAQIEGAGQPRLIDTLIYLDAEESVIERWFSDRLVPLMEAGVNDSNSFYHAFRTMTPQERRAFAARVWQGINLPNLRDHIVSDRAAADLIIHKAADHSIVSVTEK
jgi:type I pantothenate kinase